MVKWICSFFMKSKVRHCGARIYREIIVNDSSLRNWKQNKMMTIKSLSRLLVRIFMKR